MTGPIRQFGVELLRDLLSDASIRELLKDPIREVLREREKSEYLSSAEVAQRWGKSENAFKCMYSRNASLRVRAIENGPGGGLGWKWHDVEEWIRLYDKDRRAREKANAEALARLLEGQPGSRRKRKPESPA